MSVVARELAGRHFVLYAKGSPEMIASLSVANTGRSLYGLLMIVFVLM